MIGYDNIRNAALMMFIPGRACAVVTMVGVNDALFNNPRRSDREIDKEFIDPNASAVSQLQANLMLTAWYSTGLSMGKNIQKTVYDRNIAWQGAEDAYHSGVLDDGPRNKTYYNEALLREISKCD